MTPTATVGAFFDLDGTLLAPPSLEWRFISYLLAHDEINAAHLGYWMARFAKAILRNPHAAMGGNKSYVSGVRESLASDWASTLNTDPLKFFAYGIERVAWHLGQQHKVFIVSGTLEPLARVVPQFLPGPMTICATKVEVRDGRWTGQLVGEHIYRKVKARAVRCLSVQHNLDPLRSYAYGNRMDDLAMLESVGHPVAVNPSLRLERAVWKRGWQTCNWKGCPSALDAALNRLLVPKVVR
jgi:HAD superfamily hydrolase (TIGR01490 family)